MPVLTDHAAHRVVHDAAVLALLDLRSRRPLRPRHVGLAIVLRVLEHGVEVLRQVDRDLGDARVGTQLGEAHAALAEGEHVPRMTEGERSQERADIEAVPDGDPIRQVVHDAELPREFGVGIDRHALGEMRPELAVGDGFEAAAHVSAIRLRDASGLELPVRLPHGVLEFELQPLRFGCDRRGPQGDRDARLRAFVGEGDDVLEGRHCTHASTLGITTPRGTDAHAIRREGVVTRPLGVALHGPFSRSLVVLARLQ
jgi:hypothetical protein